MLFSSLVFLFCFLPFATVGYYLIRHELRNLFLLLVSLFFYGWGGIRYLLVMLGIIVVNYVGGVALEGFGKRKVVLWTCIVINLAVLGYYKYTDFLIGNCNMVFGCNLPLKHIVLPIGISFYIFQSLSYVIDVYRGAVSAQRNLLNFALYVSMFPQLVAGPIVRYSDIVGQLEKRITDTSKIADGLRRFIIGLGKKVILANTMGEVADKVYASGTNDISLMIAWLGAIAYSLQIFYDFSGYSDMAIGLGRIFGFKFLENFDYPYISSSISEFWRRWHISLGIWFKEYVYIPLGGNRVSVLRQCVNLVIVFFATGLWHGASWNFVAWGLWHGFFIVLERCLKIQRDSKWKVVLSHVYVIFVFIVGWVFFRSDDFTMAVQYIGVMFGLKVNEITSFGLMYYLTQKVIVTGVIAILFCYPSKWMEVQRNVFVMVKDCGLLFILVYCIASIAASGYNPFIYFRF